MSSLTSANSFTKSLTDDNIDEEKITKEINENGLCWNCTSDGTIWWGAQDIRQTIEPGLYKCINLERTGPALKQIIVSTDDLIRIESSETIKVIREIEEFWKPETEKRFRDRKFVYKRGILMYGEPGVGKTGTIQILIHKIIERNGVAIYADDPHLLSACLQTLRRREPNRPVVVILEDFETLTDRERRENEWLAVLDGESQVDNIVFLATTNYINNLDKRFTDRPSRFDIIVPVSMPTAEARAIFLTHKEPTFSKEELGRWVKDTEGMSMAHLKELMISVKVFNKSYDDELDRLRQMGNREHKSEDDLRNKKKTMGFGFNGGERNDDTFDVEKFWSTIGEKIREKIAARQAKL